jgi:hypothetical protein
MSIPSAYFGLHIHRATSTTPWPTVPFGAWRLIAAYVEWPWLEPRRGEWHFETLDAEISLAEKKGVEVMIPLAYTPTWASARPRERPRSYPALPGLAAEPKHMDDWRTYVSTVANRYAGRVRYYEIWNEPNLREFFTGTTEQMVALSREACRILKTVDPRIVVISPSPTLESGVFWLGEFLSKGGGECVDVIGYHFYVSPLPPEAMVPLIARVKRVLSTHGVAGKPLWNTETGWYIANDQTAGLPERGRNTNKALDQREAAAYVARSYILGWAAGIRRFYWYSWDNKETGLTEPDGRSVKEPARAYAAVYNWLVGGRLGSCSRDDAGTWTCALVRKGGATGTILWNPDRTLSITLPESSELRRVHDLDGGTRVLSARAEVHVGPSPILVERDRVQ